MATIMEETTAEKPPKVSRSDRKRYEQSVLDGVCSDEILFGARRIKNEWTRDRATFEARQQACEVLRVKVPELERVAAGAARAAAEAEAFSRGTIADSMSVAELRQRIAAAHPTLRVGTPTELAAALQWFTGTMPNQGVGILKSKAITARAAVQDTIARAQQVLRQTAAEHREDPEVARLAGKMAELESRIRSRHEVLAAESKVAAARAQCEKIASGDRPSDFSSYHQPGQQRPPLATLYRAARARLDQLLDLVARKPDAARDNQRDLEELAQLKVKLGETQHAALVRLADPKAMKWCGDE
jgi:hypothetical protein